MGVVGGNKGHTHDKDEVSGADKAVDEVGHHDHPPRKRLETHHPPVEKVLHVELDHIGTCAIVTDTMSAQTPSNIPSRIHSNSPKDT